VKRNWEKLKLQEKGENSSVLEGVPTSLPALVKAVRMQDKVRGIGFDFANKKDVWAKVKEELAEFEAEVEVDDTTKMEAEFGDLLFSLVNYSRHVNINPEDALERTNKKFRKRFQAMENAIHVDNKNLSDMNLAQMDVYWEKVKKELEP
jgi:XTP/dITP diphosphohydrolase